jgi:type I restriction enzyme S subunit
VSQPVAHSNAEPPIEIGASDWAIVQALLSAQMAGWEVWAFGSRARHAARQFSDLDLAVLAPTPLSLEQLARIHDAFDDSHLTIKVDVVDLLAISDAFKAVIDSHKLRLQ